ncbi:Rho GTPase activating protein 24 [Balamuthia mandrillaris]
MGSIDDDDKAKESGGGGGGAGGGGGGGGGEAAIDKKSNENNSPYPVTAVDDSLVRRILGEKYREGMVVEVPTLFTASLLFLEQNGLDKEGIFRIPGGARAVAELRESFLSRRQRSRTDDTLQAMSEFKGASPYTVCSFLTNWLQTQEPLLTFSLHTRWIQIAEAPDVVTRLTQYMVLIEALPAFNHVVLYLLFEFLLKVGKHVEETKMSFSNLGTIFGPLICRQKDSSVAQDFSIVPQVAQIAIAFLEHFDELFNAAAPQAALPASSSGDRRLRRRPLPFGAVASRPAVGAMAPPGSPVTNVGNHNHTSGSEGETPRSLLGSPREDKDSVSFAVPAAPQQQTTQEHEEEEEQQHKEEQQPNSAREEGEGQAHKDGHRRMRQLSEMGGFYVKGTALLKQHNKDKDGRNGRPDICEDITTFKASLHEESFKHETTPSSSTNNTNNTSIDGSPQKKKDKEKLHSGSREKSGSGSSLMRMFSPRLLSKPKGGGGSGGGNGGADSDEDSTSVNSSESEKGDDESGSSSGKWEREKGDGNAHNSNNKDEHKKKLMVFGGRKFGGNKKKKHRKSSSWPELEIGEWKLAAKAAEEEEQEAEQGRLPSPSAKSGFPRKPSKNSNKDSKNKKKNDGSETTTLPTTQSDISIGSRKSQSLRERSPSNKHDDDEKTAKQRQYYEVRRSNWVALFGGKKETGVGSNNPPTTTGSVATISGNEVGLHKWKIRLKESPLGAQPLCQGRPMKQRRRRRLFSLLQQQQQMATTNNTTTEGEEGQERYRFGEGSGTLVIHKRDIGEEPKIRERAESGGSDTAVELSEGETSDQNQNNPFHHDYDGGNDEEDDYDDESDIDFEEERTSAITLLEMYYGSEGAREREMARLREEQMARGRLFYYGSSEEEGEERALTSRRQESGSASPSTNALARSTSCSSASSTSGSKLRPTRKVSG